MTNPTIVYRVKMELQNLLCILVKVLSFLEACFDLISSSSLSMKIQMMGRKIQMLTTSCRILTSIPPSFIKFFRTLKYSTYLILWWKIGSTVNGFESWCQKNRHRPPPTSCGGLHKTHVDFVHGCITFQPQNFQPLASTPDFPTTDT